MNRPQTAWARGANPFEGMPPFTHTPPKPAASKPAPPKPAEPEPKPLDSKGLDPHTGKLPMREVPVPPKRPLPRKGRTKYDEEFGRLLAGKAAIQVHEVNSSAMRRALKRYVTLQGLQGKVALRQQINRENRTLTLWLEKKEDV